MKLPTHVIVVTLFAAIGCETQPAPEIDPTDRQAQSMREQLSPELAKDVTIERGEDGALRPKASPALMAQMQKAIARQKHAVEIDKSINAAVEIDELSVAIGGDVASISGYARDAKSRAEAEEIALAHPTISKVLNGIVVR